MEIYWLHCYPPECVLASRFGVCERTALEWCRYICERIQALKLEKVSATSLYLLLEPCVTVLLTPLQIALPQKFNSTFIMSIDGTHSRILEPKHPARSRNPQFYSHKCNGPAVAYEIAMSLWESKVLWVGGPFPAASHDISMFRQGGLRGLIPVGKSGW